MIQTCTYLYSSN